MKRDWRALAAAAMPGIDAARQGEREAALAAAAETAAVKPQTLRTYLKAARFEATLDDELRQVTRHIPPIALEAAARWYARDPEAAGKAMRGYAQGGYQVHQFIKAEQAARPSEDAGLRPLGRRKSDYRRALLTRLGGLERLWPDPERYAFASTPIVDEAAADASGVADLLLICDGATSLAILIVGPYSEPRHYTARAAEWVLRALGLAYYHEKTALILPPEAGAASERYVRLLKAVSRERLPEVRYRVELLCDPGPWR